jgi:hypothetical protein
MWFGHGAALKLLQRVCCPLEFKKIWEISLCSYVQRVLDLCNKKKNAVMLCISIILNLCKSILCLKIYHKHVKILSISGHKQNRKFYVKR